MSPAKKKPGMTRKTDQNHTSPAAVGDLQALVDQVQALRRRHKAQPSPASAAELSRLRGLLLEALDLDEDDTSGDSGDSGDREDAVDFDAHDQDPYPDDMQEEVWEEDESGGWRGRRNWAQFTPAKRIPVDAGLELRSRRGAIGESWWSRRFLSAVESVLTGGRLARGRTYARQGQVIDLGIGSGLVVAQVQGTRKTPYGVQISMPAASDVRWEVIVGTLASQAGYAARLLAGELPHEIEDVFSKAGVALFPERGSHLVTSCTCPDWANPCKHAAAVCYLMAEAFDDDPFLLLAFRGRERQALLAELRGQRGSALEDANVHPSSADPTLIVSPLSECMANFWSAGPELANVHCLPRATEFPGAVLRQLPRGVLEVRGRDIADLLSAAYDRLAIDAEARAFGVGPPSRPAHDLVREDSSTDSG
jgi:uncharacterized Zn finger protein